MGAQNRHNVLFLDSISLKKMKRKAITIKQIAEIFKKGNSNIYEDKKIMLSGL